MTSPKSEVARHRHRIAHGEKKGKVATGTAKLTYFIFEGELVGSFGSEIVHFTTWSGGGGGSLKNSPNGSANNPYMYGLKEVDGDKGHKHVHGGPIPPGAYQIKIPEQNNKLGLCAKLDPFHELPNDRGGMAIHGEGQHGSDGCIVLHAGKCKPACNDDLHKLMEKLRVSTGGILLVLQATE